MNTTFKLLRVISDIALFILMALAGILLFSTLSPSGLQPGSAPAIVTPFSYPTPVPTSRIPLIALTPPGPFVRPDPATYTPMPTPKSGDPFNLSVYPNVPPVVSIYARSATLIVIGTVKQVGVARWDTVDGRRPEDPHSLNRGKAGPTIFRPVWIQVEHQLKGAQPQSTLLVKALGGQVGADSVEYPGFHTYDFKESEHVLVFMGNGSAMLDSAPLYDVLDHFTIIPQGSAIGNSRTMPLQQLLDEINTAL